MVIQEAPRLYPVFTHHAKELQAAARYLVGRMEQYRKDHIPDSRFNDMLNRHKEVIRTLSEMEHTREPFVYLTQDEKELVVRVNAWLRMHPEHRTA